MKNTFIVMSITAAVLLAVTAGAFAQSDPLSGLWGISTSGEAELGAATSGKCTATGTVPAGLYDALILFDHGQILIQNLGINIGATNCTSPNFQGTGSYKVTERGNGGFEAKGTFTSQFVGRPAACSATRLNDVAFTVLGKIGDNSLTITINGLDSGAYAEGPPPGPLSCKAPVLNLIGMGTGQRF